MNETLQIIAAAMLGGVLGGFFFGGLWWTVHRGVLSSSPAFWFLGSLLLRMGTILAGFYFIGHENWKRLVACLVGFILARLFVVYLTRPRLARAREASHAS